MPDTQTVAEALAIVVAVADAAFVVAMAFVVNKYFGVWEAVAVAAVIIFVNGIVLLYAIGEMGDRKRDVANTQRGR